MKIETKFDIGQEVWFINEHYAFSKRSPRVDRGKIDNVRIFALKGKAQINYRICDDSCSHYGKHSYKEKQLFITEAEAQAKLTELLNK